MEVWIFVSLPKKSHVLGTGKLQPPNCHQTAKNTIFPPKHEKKKPKWPTKNFNFEIDMIPPVPVWSTARQVGIWFPSAGPVMSRPPGHRGGPVVARWPVCWTQFSEVIPAAVGAFEVSWSSLGLEKSKQVLVIIFSLDLPPIQDSSHHQDD